MTQNAGLVQGNRRLLELLNAVMYWKRHNGQLSIEYFHVSFGGTLDPDNRWELFSSLMPWEELEETYAPQLNPTTGAPAKPVRLEFK